MPIKIVALGGSLAQQSTSLAAVRVALDGASDAGAEVELFDVRALNLPMYSPNPSAVPPAARSFCESVYGCHGMLWSSPLYHGTISGSFKNALDWLQLIGDRRPPYLTDKVVGLISTAGGTQGLQAVNTMEFIVRALRGWAVPLVIPIPQAWRIFQQGRVLDDAVASQLRALGAEVARAAEHFSAGRITSPEAGTAEATLQPVSEDEVRSAKTS
jgi:FMN reductase